MAIHVALVNPAVHWNTGNAGRTCIATGATLHLVQPVGFAPDEAKTRRAGLDYWEHVDLRVWPGWMEFESAIPSLGKPFIFSARGSRTLWDAPLGASEDVVLIFGCEEGGGLSPELLRKYRDRVLSMPMVAPQVASINLSTSVGIAVYEVLRQRRTAHP